MNTEAVKKIALMYCKWCPKDCQGLTEEEKLGCLAAGGFVDDLPGLLEELGYRKLPKDRPRLREELKNFFWRKFAEYPESFSELLADQILAFIPDGLPRDRLRLREALGQLDLHLTYDNYLSAKDIDQILALIF